jgi:predicted RNA binding protein YcfA (HicA-like mRNA interferase family)
MRYKELATKLRRLGCEELREGRGSHGVWYNPENDRTVAIPDWGSRDLATGTVRAVERELGISRQQFGSLE